MASPDNERPPLTYLYFPGCALKGTGVAYEESLLTLFALLGLCGSGFVLTYACAKEVCAPALSGMAISVVNTGLFLGAAIMQPLFGWVLDQGWNGAMRDGARLYDAGDYHNALLLMLAFAVVAFVAALRAGGLPKALNILGLIVGALGIISIFPALTGLVGVFGLGQMIWFVWLAMVLLRSSVAVTVQPHDTFVLRHTT